jgi:hypothetical protein
MNLLPDFLHHGRALCTGTPDLFTTCTAANVQKAKTICGGCPLRTECMTWALDQEEPIGVWGGLSPSERAQLRHGPGWWVDEEGRIRQPCGSDPAYRTHLKYGEQPCDTCAAGQEQRTTERRRAILAEEHALPAGGSVRGYDTHRRLGEEACGPCTSAKAVESAVSRARRATRRAARSSSGPMALAS